MARTHNPTSAAAFRLTGGRAYRLVRRLIFAMSFFVFAVMACGQGAIPEDPLPLHRIVVPRNRLTAELEKVKQGALVKLPRADFEERVRQASAAKAQAPKLVRAHYAAELIGTNLSQGRGQWTTENTGSTPGILSVGAFSMALSRCRWESGEEAVLGDLDGKTLGLLVNPGEPANLFFDWSARGVVGARGLIFDLFLPACPRTTLELKLPADVWPVVPVEAALLTGPRDTGTATTKLWQLHLTGKSRLELVVRKLREPTTTTVLFSQLQTRQQINPDRVICEYEFQIEAPQGSVHDLVFHGRGDLEPFEVTARSAEIESWRWHEPAKVKDAKSAESSRRALTVQFREPQHGTVSGLRVRCLAPRPADGPWTSPVFELADAISRGESLRLHFHPDIHVGQWESRDFRLTGTLTEAQGGQVLQLVDTRSSAGGGRRPGAMLKTQAVEFNTLQKGRFRFHPSAAMLDAEIAYDVTRGQLFQLAIRLPEITPAYRVEAVELEPKSIPHVWSVSGSLLLVDLQRGLTPRMDATLRVRLRSPLRGEAAPLTVELPDVEPKGAATRFASYTVSVDPLFDPQLQQANVPTLLDAATTDGQESEPPAFAFQYRNQVLTGTLGLFPRRSKLELRSQQEVRLSRTEGSWQARIDVQPLLGNSQSIDVYLSAPLNGSLHVDSAEDQPAIQRVERLPQDELLPALLGLGCNNPLQLALLTQGLPRGQHWRLHFAQPLRKAAQLQLSGTFAPERLPFYMGWFTLSEPGGVFWNALANVATLRGAERSEEAARWRIPVLFFPGTMQRKGSVDVRCDHELLEFVGLRGLNAMPIKPTLSPASTPATRLRFELRDDDAFPELIARRAPGSIPQRRAARFDCAELTTFILPDGTQQHHYRFRVWQWDEPRCLVVIPEGKELLAACVQNSWLDCVTSEVGALGLRVSVPVIAGAPEQVVELFYRGASAGPGAGFVSVSAPEPILPRAPLAFHRVWKLASAWIPFQQRQVRSAALAPGLNYETGLGRALNRVWFAGESLPFLNRSEDAEQSQSLKQFLGAEATFRGRLQKDTTFGDALERFAFDYLKDQSALVIDRRALRSEGLDSTRLLTTRPASLPIGRPFWEPLGLIHVPTRHGVLLTTKVRVENWLRQAGSVTMLTESLDTATLEAVVHGRDRSGQLASVTEWLRDDAGPSGARERSASVTPFTSILDMEWTDWEPIEGLPDDGTLLLIDARCGWIAGFFLAGALLLLAFWLQSRVARPWGLRLHFVALSSLALLSVWLSPPLDTFVIWPMLAAESLVIVTYLLTGVWSKTTVLRGGPLSSIRPGSITAGLTLLLGFIPLLGWSQAPAADAFRVLLIPGAEQSQDFTLVSPDLLKTLESMTGKKTSPVTGAVLLTAKYQGKIRDERAEIDASFELFQADDVATLVIPLAGINLTEGAFLDGVPVFPVAHKSGYSVTVRGKGLHRLALSFEIRLSPSGATRELRFAGPKLVQSQLEVTWASPIEGLAVVNHLGEVTISMNGDGRARAVNAQLGAEGLVLLRWQSDLPPPAALPIELREAYYWDLRAASLALTGVIEILASQEPVSRLRFALPEGLDVRSVDTSPRLPGGGAGASVPQWQVLNKAGGRQLHVEFAKPILKGAHVVIEMAPRLALTPGSWSLRLPLPVQATLTESVLAYRLDGMEITHQAQNLAVATLAAEQFNRAWAKAGLREPQAITQAYSFRRTSAAAVLGMTVQPRLPQAKTTTTWRTMNDSLELTAKVHLTASADDLMFIALQVPPEIVLADVSGLEVHHWSRVGDRLHVWLQQPRKQIRFELRGWTKLAGSLRSAKELRVDLPVTQVLNSNQGATSVRLVPREGIQIVPQQLDRLQPDDAIGPFSYTADDSRYRAVFLLRSVPTLPVARVWTRVNGQTKTMHWTTIIGLQGAVGNVRLVLEGWKGTLPQFEFPHSMTLKSYRQAGTEHHWTLDLPPGLPFQIPFVLRGIASPGSDARWELPSIRVESAVMREHWLTLDNVGLAPAALRGLRNVYDPAEMMAPPIDEAKARFRHDVYRVDESKTRLKLINTPVEPPSVPLVLLSTQHARMVRSDRWLHELHLEVHSPRDGELRVRFPEGASLQWLIIDESPVTAAARETGELLIPLRGSPSVQRLVIQWNYAENAERNEAPRVEQPVLVAAEPSLARRRVWVPNSYPPAMIPEHLLTSEAATLLADAETHLGRSSAPLSRDVIVDEQKSFYASLRYAEYALARLLAVRPEAASLGLTERAKSLRLENARSAKVFGYETIRSRAEAIPPALLPSSSEKNPRSDFSLVGRGAVPFGNESLVFRSEFDRQSAANQSWTEGVLLTAAALLILTWLRPGLALLTRFAPELIGCVALAGIAAWGVSFTGALLLLLAAVVRGIWFVQVFARRYKLRPLP